MLTDPIVQSIQTAIVLTEQLKGLIVGGGFERPDDAELRVGEAQSLVPEIWRHLDEARGQLAARGTDVSAYDHVRRDQPASMLAATDMRTALAGPNLASPFTGTSTRKAAKFDPYVCDRASSGCRALMDAMPDVDWQQLARETADLVATTRLGPSPVARAVVGIVVAALAVGAALVLRGL